MITAAPRPLVVYAKNHSSDSKKSSSSSDKSSEKKNEINAKIKENESAISDAQQQKDQLKTGMDAVQAIVNSLESTKNSLEGYVTQLDANLSEIQGEIDDLNDQIDVLNDQIDQLNIKIEEKEKEIEQAQQELKEAREELDQKYEDTKQHIKYMYQVREATFLDILLSASGIQDLLNRTEYISSMANYDRRQLDEYKAAKKVVEEKEATLNEENKELMAVKAQIEEKKAEISDQEAEAAQKGEEVSQLISVKEQEISLYEADINNKEAQIKEYKDMIAAQDAIIRSLEEAIAAQRRALEADENGGGALRTYDGGEFAFPAPSYTRISDDYGNRIHPTLGVEQFHNGIDLAAPSGSPILAAYDGEVIAADYSATMGNYIMIDHGDGLFTIYMHASSLLVSKGAQVTRGQKIATVGSTGRSTGPHLHFSVRRNGSYVSPWNYLK